MPQRNIPPGPDPGRAGEPSPQVDIEYVDGVALGRIQGEIDTANVSDVERTLGDVAGTATQGVVVDLTRATYFNSAFIKVLFDLSQQLRERNQQLRIAIPDGAPMRRVLAIVRLDTLIPLHSSVDEALAMLLDAQRDSSRPGSPS